MTLKLANAAVIAGLLGIAAAARADVSVSQEQVRDRRGKLTKWTAVQLDSGRKIFAIRSGGRHVGLGPGIENWYGNGFLVVDISGAKTDSRDAALTVVKRGPEVGSVNVTWHLPNGPVTALFELRDGDDKLLLTLKLPKATHRTVRFLCYPSSFAGGYTKGKAIRKRHGVTATREVVLGDKHGFNTPLTAAEPWALFMDDHFDVAHKRGAGPCAALYFPREVTKATASTSNYSCYLTLQPKPDVTELHVVLWDFTGMSNADAVQYMKGLSVSPVPSVSR